MIQRVRPFVLALAALLAPHAVWGQQQAGFDHEEHRKVFPECQGCHAGVVDAGRAVFPASAVCTSCHDGTTEKRVAWAGPPTRTSNLRFDHAEHFRKSGARLPGDSALACSECHIPAGAEWLTVRRTISGQCLQCHGIRTAHVSAPDTACGTCHLVLAHASALPESRVAAFPRPLSHQAAEFRAAKGHGDLAKRGDQSCAVCHARDFCVQCHVNAPEVPAIQALAPDPRALALRAQLSVPESHRKSGFLGRHGSRARQDPARCAFCHTQASCAACHRDRPTVIASLPVAGPGRGSGAQVVRRKPSWHDTDFLDRHAATASARPSRCAACHVRAECLDCHRPAAAGGNYHPPGFLTRHPASAFNRQTECAQCHHQGAFCATCHKQSGLVATGNLQGGYHDANPAFTLNHGTAARQNIESCVACHAERDCLTCHSARQGRRFNPHGPGFDAERLRRRNPQTCSACHGRDTPGQTARP
jgi:hypothetical protein